MGTVDRRAFVEICSNLIRRINFLELEQLRITKQISEKTFKKKIKENPAAYVININKQFVKLDLVQKMMKRFLKLRDFSETEVAELFSAERIRKFP